MTPVTALAGTLAWMEAISGQLYLAITIARLVALSMADSSGSDTASRAGAVMRIAGAIALLLLALVGCATPGFRTTWTEPAASSTSLAGRTVAAFVIGIYEPLRRTAEDALVRELTARGARALAGSTLLPAPEARHPEAARPKLQQAGVEGIVALRVVARNHHTPFFALRFWSYWGVDWPSPSDPNAVTMDTVVWVEARVYSVAQDKVLWVGESVSTNTTTVDAFVKDLAAQAAESVQRAGLLGRSPASGAFLRAR